MERKVANLLRKDKVRLKELPPQIVGAILLRGLRDARYEKASLDSENWGSGRAARSWEGLLTQRGVELAILDEGSEVVWKHLVEGEDQLGAHGPRN